jgi:hypothetical protein
MQSEGRENAKPLPHESGSGLAGVALTRRYSSRRLS